MADGLCTEDPVGTLIEKTIVKDYGSLECVNDLSCENVKSFYIDSDSGKLCGPVCGAVGSAEGKLEGFLHLPCSPTMADDEDCRKKRCADRYDSSESSDSGVAALSCTDCSTYSGGSTASSASDITDPGSPFSTASSHSEDSSTASNSHPPKMAPNLAAHHPPWPWSGGGNNGNQSPPLKRMSEEKTANNNTHSTPSSKRLRTESAISTNDVKLSKTKTLPQVKDSNCNNMPVANMNTNAVTPKRQITKQRLSEPCLYSVGGKLIQQGKITEYFKAQMKPNSPSIKRDLLTTKSVVTSSPVTTDKNGVSKYFTLVDRPKDLYRKLDVRTVTTTTPSPIKKVMTEKSKKLTQITTTRKILPAPRSKSNSPSVHKQTLANQPTVKLTNLRLPHNQTQSKLAKPSETNSATSFTLQTNLNLTVSSTVVPIVKLNTLPSKLNGSINLKSLSVETAVPTIPSAKVKSAIAAATTTTTTQKFPKEKTSTSTSLDSNINSNSNCGSESSTMTSCSTEISSDASDSGVSLLTVSVAPTPTEVEPQKSPILSQPKTIRFPAKQVQSDLKHRRSDPSDSGLCRWSDCHAQFDTSGALLEHLQIYHVVAQQMEKHYTCLWIGCKVHGRSSCSRSWLERHVLGHAGNKPFRCIVDGCGCRFSSQLALEKHVNSHFDSPENGSNGSAKKSLESSTTKLFKRNGKKLRYRRQPWSARMFDFFDAGIMEGLQYRLLTMTEKRIGDAACNEIPGDSVTLQSNIMAMRTEPDGTRKALLHWSPPDIIPDEWILESKVTTTRTVQIPTLQPPAMDCLKAKLFSEKSSASSSSSQQQHQQQHTQKHRRKRVVRSS